MAATAAKTDLIVIGAGLAGISAATAAVRRGFSVTLIGAHDRHPPDFRGEKFGETQMAALDRMGLGDAARAHMTIIDGVWSYRFGRLAERSPEREYSSLYGDLINALAAALPREITRVTGRISAVETGDAVQTVTLNDGRSFTGRVLAVATGLGDAVRRMLGIERHALSAGHSLSLGFDVREPITSFAFPSMVWGREADTRISYLTMFPIGETMRGNLFVYRDIAEDWSRDFRRDPLSALRRAMPRLMPCIGAFGIASEIVARPVDIVETRNHVRPGVVLLGDAFGTVCPITGYGMAKAINDADLFANVHLPQWLASEGMGVDKIAQFYADPAKLALDSRAVSDSLVGRRYQLAETPYWRARRTASLVVNRLRDAIFTDTGPLPAPEIDAPPLAARPRIG